jgi:hypothetical protein
MQRFAYGLQNGGPKIAKATGTIALTWNRKNGAFALD